MNRLLISASILSLGLWAAGCKNDHKDTEPAGHHKMADQNMQMATANIEPTKGNNAKGTVTFMQMGEKVHVVADISGLTPNAKHGFHVHEGTECGEDGMKAGGHYNPEKHDHGMPSASADKRHAGDFGNLQADSNGKAHLDASFDNISISGAKNPIVGHALIVHKNPDDGSQPTGNAGPRIGCGIIKAGGRAASAYTKDMPDYVISSYDLLSVTIVDPDKKEVVQTARVSATGLLGLPELSDFIEADGLTERQLQKAIIQAHQQAKIHQNAKVSVTVVEARGPRAGAKVGVHQKDEPITLGYVIPRPELINTLVNPPQRDRFSSAAGVNQVDWFHLPSLDLPQTILTAEPQRSEFSIEGSGRKLETDAMVNLGLMPKVPNMQTSMMGAHVLMLGNVQGISGRAIDFSATTKPGGAK